LLKSDRPLSDLANANDSTSPQMILMKAFMDLNNFYQLYKAL
jgi:hypothetical protein